jgi:hypothetical protein
MFWWPGAGRQELHTEEANAQSARSQGVVDGCGPLLGAGLPLHAVSLDQRTLMLSAFLRFLQSREDNPMLWAQFGWYCFLAIWLWCGFTSVARVLVWLLRRDQSSWTVLWTKLLFSRWGSGYLYKLTSENEVIDCERVCLVVMADEEEGWGSSAYFPSRSNVVNRGRITYHRCRPYRNPPYPRDVVSVNGKPAANWDAVGYHAGNFIFSRRPIPHRDLAELRKKATPGEVVLPNPREESDHL